MTEDKKEWEVGTEVAVYGGYSNTPRGIAKVEKIHRNGNVVVDGIRYRPTSQGHAHQTGQGYGRMMICILTPELRLEMEKAQKLNRLRGIGAWLTGMTDPDIVPDDLARKLIEIMKEDKKRSLSSTG